ncbi:hypothetical protein B0H10DRAFT_2213055 [Mycena sp. CBHHK59/15]|nr:hypothetical protein B0H10DRAFT_2213055 [Mycena sp. CBHHK59/15]
MECNHRWIISTATSYSYINVAVIRKIADHLVAREEIMLEKQQWRDTEDRLRGMWDVCKKWIDVATKTKEAIEATKKDAEKDKAKLDILDSLTAALNPSNIEPIQNTKLRFECINEGHLTQGLLDIVIAGTAREIKEAVKSGQNNWVRAINKAMGPGFAYKSALGAVVEEL